MSNVATHRWVSCSIANGSDGPVVIEHGPVPPRPAPPPEKDLGPPNVEVTAYSIPQGRTAYVEGQRFFYRGDIEMLLALADPIPGSQTADFVSRCVRKIPKIKPLFELSEESRRRVNRLRRNLNEPSVAQIEQLEQMRALLAEQLAALG
jgi:hypothetical protein